MFFSDIPPQNSVNYALHPHVVFECIERGIGKYASLGKASLKGVINSRCGNWSDVLPLHNAFDRYINDIETDDSSRGQTGLPEHRTMDTVTNASGHKLLKLCLSSDLRIVNGRMNDIGQFVCCCFLFFCVCFLGQYMYMYLSTNGNSLIDYVRLISEELFPFIWLLIMWV